MADTICALASGSPPAAIAIIRISGPATRAIISDHLVAKTLAPKSATLTTMHDVAGERIDEGLALFSKGPSSYTGEDTLELYLHGGRAVIEHALDTLTARDDTRLAEPGEFTRRAFEAGKLDLTEAEGVADTIEAETRAQKAQALRQLGGALSQTYNQWREDLTSILALLEVAIDFPDEGDAPQNTDDPVIRRLDTLSAQMQEALGDGGIGERIRDGFRVAIIGPPNAGKSTLLNHFAKRDAAIVTDIPGTTRDVIEVRTIMGGQIIWFADTAGLRETDDVIEAEGVKRATQVAKNADLRIFLHAAGEPKGQSALTAPFRTERDLDVVNKIDLVAADTDTHDLSISVKTGVGLDALELRISDWARALVSQVEAPVITRARHRSGIARGLTHLTEARDRLLDNDGAELAAEDIRLAVRSLAGLVGEVGVEAVLGSVFSKFCIGK